MSTRYPAVADMFYPGDADDLRASIQTCFASARTLRTPLPRPPKALVLPHAGYIYSGPIAASGYRLLGPLRNKIQRVILLGPSHRVPLRGIALPTQRVFATPLGDIPIDTAMLAKLATLPHVAYLDAAHSEEHSLEVHLPFLQQMLGERFRLVPMVVGETQASDVANVLNQVWGGDETLIIISSDLSHYLPYPLATDVDKATGERIVHLQDNLEGDEACGCHPLNGLLLAAKQHGLQAELLDLRNSGDTRGSKNHVVGYGAFAFY